ncbi:TPA: DNA/RNA non-specific endonuclease [Raoultella ornithinolytica]|uniref:DNA/RNA non-specific endonuclease n=1 Tax=Raoultella TaxID=160674 RepID=UPI001783B711|nr:MULTISPECIES: DNA/RNA non-specific endonuclease [Raoultella]MBD9718113.1 DNA/RNA non-specific endonuclease [Raoultella sp. RLT01]MEC5097989.1 DNA/RNA non-specific endonuclease [Raoultella ornithinolytica]MEC5111196.1 DNA/RNA non-specific endonuclease [Raoultella ornithinolytica]HAV2258069.1 DNA/RNA non-specific endonuclease [Raoultella ornithinolytica]HCT8710079.1 DNA/RNA non-specific endonuclease [Raoultella ornithinolytica]
MRIYYRYLCLWFVFLLFSCTTSYQPSTQFPVTTDNCEVGCPSGGSDQTLVRDSYTLNNNSNTKFANWVAYKMTKSSQASGRPRDWKRDPALPPADTLSPDAYQNANTLLGVDRGHQAPLAGLGGASDWPSLNYLSNITPQKADLNQGAWVRLEDKERELANRSDVTAVYSVTGPLFERHIATLPADPSVEIPSAYWKIIFIGVSPDKGQYAAFLMDQSTPKAANFCDYQVTVDLIESKTNPKLSIWSSLPAKVSAHIKATKGTLASEMGCL